MADRPDAGSQKERRVDNVQPERPGDPAIEEIRAVRRMISAEHGHDIRSLLRHYREMDKKFADRLVRE